MLSIVIPTRNRSELLLDCVQSIIANKKANIELIIVDDGSTLTEKKKNQKIVTFAKKHFSTDYIYQKQQFQGAARNKGIRRAKGTIIAFLDDDCVVLPSWVHTILQKFGDPHIQVISGSIKPFSDAPVSLVAHLAERHYENISGTQIYPSLVYNLIVRRELLFQKNIFFAENRQNLAEDIEFNYKLFKAGISIYYDADISCKHKYPENFKDFFGDQFHFRRSRTWLKHNLENYPYVASNENSIFRKFKYGITFPIRCFYLGIQKKVNPLSLMFLGILQESLFL